MKEDKAQVWAPASEIFKDPGEKLSLWCHTEHGDNAPLLFTNTDIFTYETLTEDFYKDIALHVQNDTSKYLPERPSGIATGVNRVIGKFKEEAFKKVKGVKTMSSSATSPLRIKRDA